MLTVDELRAMTYEALADRVHSAREMERVLQAELDAAGRHSDRADEARAAAALRAAAVTGRVQLLDLSERHDAAAGQRGAESACDAAGAAIARAHARLGERRAELDALRDEIDRRSRAPWTTGS